MAQLKASAVPDEVESLGVFRDESAEVAKRLARRSGAGLSGPLWSERGVTLVELMVVVTIIAIIAAIAITLYQDVQKKAKLAGDQGTAAAMRSAIAMYYGNKNGNFPPDVATISGLVTPAPAWNCSVTVVYDGTNGKLTNSATIGDC